MYSWLKIQKREREKSQTLLMFLKLLFSLS